MFQTISVIAIVVLLAVTFMLYRRTKQLEIRQRFLSQSLAEILLRTGAEPIEPPVKPPSRIVRDAMDEHVRRFHK